MKKLHELTLGAAIALLALSACTNETDLLLDVPQMSEPGNPNECILAADDFRWEGNQTRTALAIEGDVAKFSWASGDRIGILPDEGAQVYFTIPESETLAEGDELTDEQRRKASFDGGAWSLRVESNYAAYYPFIKDFDLQRTAVPVSYIGQKQTGITTTHLGAYDYMGARPVTTNENGGGVTFDFDHVGALVLLKFTVPKANTVLKNVTLSADGATFITQGTYNLTSDKADGFPITASATADAMTVGIDYTTTQANEEVTLYFMCAPIDLSGKIVNVSIACGEGGSASTLTLYVAGKNIEAANGYALTTVMGNIIDPSQTAKGDYAMKDGTFIKYDANKTLTDEQKANVAGIVFWTTGETNTAGRATPASLADDKIMKTDFPDCTHGLIVSMKNVSAATKWQEYNYYRVNVWQIEEFTAVNKSDYKSILSGTGPTDPINYILGYQNTKLLKAFNAAVSSDYGVTVLPVSLLTNFSANNPAPANTTGWFIPSVKELHMLCYKDVDNIAEAYNATYIDTRTAINNSLNAVGGEQLGTGSDVFFWSSTETSFAEQWAFALRFAYANVASAGKSADESTYYVRAVCAY